MAARVPLFARLSANVKAFRKEASLLARSIDQSTAAGTDLQAQLDHAAEIGMEFADLLTPARWHKSSLDTRSGSSRATSC
jgi:hypothetical protein